MVEQIAYGGIESGEQPHVILERIKAQLPSWKDVTMENVRIKRLQGLSNAVYRVECEKLA
jgi:hypothetical protein